MFNSSCFTSISYLESNILKPDNIFIVFCDENATYLQTFFDYSNVDYELLRNYLREIEWDTLKAHNLTIYKCAENFTSNSTKSAYSTSPNKTCLKRNKDKPWMRNHIRNEMCKRRKLHKVAKRDDTPEPWVTYRFEINKVIS